jgi:hypothetical protein
LLKLQQKKIFKASAQQSPRGRESRDSPADYNYSRALPIIAGKIYAKPAAKAMTRGIGCADDLAFGQRRLSRRAACGERHGQAEKRREYFSPRNVLCWMGTGWHG